MDLSDKIKDTITLERVQIVEETDSFFRVQYAGNAYGIAKSTESSFDNGAPESASGDGVEPNVGQKLEQRLLLVPGTNIFQDETVPIAYKEVMMFHEIRKMQYREAFFEDAHQRAVNDELLYVIKFFDEETREGYLEFARKYRAASEKTSESIDELVDLDVSDFYTQWKTEVKWGQGEKHAYERAEDRLKITKNVTTEKLAALVQMLDEEQRSFFDISDIETAKGKYSHALLSALINRIPDSEGEVRFTLPLYYVEEVRAWCMGYDGKPIQNRDVRKSITEEFKEFLKRKNVTIMYDSNEQPIKF